MIIHYQQITHMFIYVVSSFLELVPKLFQIEGVTCFLSESVSRSTREVFRDTASMWEDK